MWGAAPCPGPSAADTGGAVLCVTRGSAVPHAMSLCRHLSKCPRLTTLACYRPRQAFYTPVRSPVGVCSDTSRRQTSRARGRRPAAERPALCATVTSTLAFVAVLCLHPRVHLGLASRTVDGWACPSGGSPALQRGRPHTPHPSPAPASGPHVPPRPGWQSGGPDALWFALLCGRHKDTRRFGFISRAVTRRSLCVCCPLTGV